ncbi:Dimer_Tnp_hAT domain-containing protein [Caenorhabditis elegans]|uniref:Dimer_Tnp_hAT domain-containing protein n=1 Tax=Caenorhabditis elegans TaxID=6239 RepID=O44882_CAEEL|nr:Dimer_Tnp_hAT domain-containing protein [Caenorhabditis elegans]CCD69330.1 Dimer_Tnp_hAT domain-containing protein [Caenorhabditis elegans]|eukprot:NP_494647.1 Uncharacterized protein CELE_T24E12.3 [Caenorhabditis elegans]
MNSVFAENSPADKETLAKFHQWFKNHKKLELISTMFPMVCGLPVNICSGEPSAFKRVKPSRSLEETERLVRDWEIARRMFKLVPSTDSNFSPVLQAEALQEVAATSTEALDCASAMSQPVQSFNEQTNWISWNWNSQSESRLKPAPEPELSPAYTEASAISGAYSETARLPTTSTTIKRSRKRKDPRKIVPDSIVKTQKRSPRKAPSFDVCGMSSSKIFDLWCAGQGFGSMQETLQKFLNNQEKLNEDQEKIKNDKERDSISQVENSDGSSESGLADYSLFPQLLLPQ